MRKILDDRTVAILKTRIYISRTIHVFRCKQIAEGFGISLATFHRYDNEANRMLSRLHARLQTERLKEEQNLIECANCGELLEGHPRCLDCTILMHTDESMCRSCIDSRFRRQSLHHGEALISSA